nr:hypothetical protein [uncultured Romboutsia sp.]
MTCNCCNSANFNYLTSSTNSTYTYCRDCNTNFDIAYKNMTIDSMLIKLVETLNYLKTDHLKIEVKQSYNTIGLIINNINVFLTDFKYEFLKKDIYYIENVIFELVQDFPDFDLSKVDIIVCN